MTTVLWLIYLAGVVEALGFVFALFAILGGAVSTMICAYCITEVETDSPMFSHAQKGLRIAAVCLLLMVLVPSKSFIYTLAGLKTADVAIESVQGSDTAQKAIRALDSKLDEMLAEIEESK